MQTIIIDEEFRHLLPGLDAQTYSSLEESIIKHGCLSPLVLWEGILIDGYNRYKICIEHDIPFETVEKEFGSREEVLIWIISHQMARRNLTAIQLTHFRGLHYRAEVKIRGASNQFSRESEKSQNATQQGSTATRLGKQYRVSRDTIVRDSKASRGIDAIGEASSEAKRKLLSGEVVMNKKKLESLASLDRGEIETIAAEIEDGTYQRKQPVAPGASVGDEPAVPMHPEVQRLDSAIRDMTSEFLSDFRKQGSGGVAELKAALRSHIDMLERLYMSL